MTAVEQIYIQLPLDLQITQLLYEYFAGGSKLKMNLRSTWISRTSKAIGEKAKKKNTHDEGKERNKETKSSGNKDTSRLNDASTTCDINTSVANCINDDTPPHDLPSEDNLAIMGSPLMERRHVPVYAQRQ
eukprot:8259807-Ditylum_brightwellii.AAC.1